MVIIIRFIQRHTGNHCDAILVARQPISSNVNNAKDDNVLLSNQDDVTCQSIFL